MSEPRTGASPLLDPHLLARVEGLPVAVRLIVEGYVAGLHKSPFQGFSIEFAEHREYVPGDDIRHVDWKAYAKVDRYYVKQFEQESQLTIYLVLDASASMAFAGGGLSKLEYAGLSLAALAYLAIPIGSLLGLPTRVVIAATLPVPLAAWRLARIAEDKTAGLPAVTSFAVMLLVGTAAAEVVAFATLATY